METAATARVALCQERGIVYTPVDESANSGFALKTKGSTPIHGLRHSPTSDTTGWYVWCGEFSARVDFFSPLCTSHLCEHLPEISSLLGLPAGYRFLVADGYLDIWYDETLKNT